VSNSAVETNTPAFQRGYTEGLTGVKFEQRGWSVEQPITETDIVEIITNLTEIAVEGWLSDDLLRHDAGLIVDWIARGVYQPASKQ